MQSSSSSSPSSTDGLLTPKALSTISSQQSSAETFRDLPKITITVPAERVARPNILSSSSPDSRVAEETNEGFKQNNCKQDEMSYHNTGTCSGEYYLNAQNTSKRVRMLSDNNLDKKLFQLLGSKREDSKLIIPDLPEIDHLMIVHREIYKQRLLDKMLNYGRIIEHPYLQEGSSGYVSRTVCYPLDHPWLSDGYRLHRFNLVNIESFKRGIGLLRLGCVKEGKNEIIKAADKELPHAMYVYAIITFKEIVQCITDSKSQLPKKKDIEKAVQYMFRIEQDFFPLPSFILGIMMLYDQISIIQKFAAQVTSARKCFDYVLNGIKYSEGNYSIYLPMKCIIIEDEHQKCLEWIVQSIKYEFAIDMILCQEDLFDAKSLLKELSSEGFIDAKYIYALALLKNTFSDQQIFKKFNFDRAYTLLEQAIYHGHKEAMFFFGTLPFIEEFKLLDKESQSLKGSFCFGYLGTYIKACGKNGDFKKDAEILIAAEYVTDKSSYVTYDEEMAKYILEENNCSYQLEKLKEKLQEREERATNKLPDVLSALENVHSELKKDIEPSAQKLLSKVKELLDALQVSGLIVQQSPLLSPTLELLHMPSAMELGFLILSLQQLYNVLEPQVVSQLHYSSRKEILPLLHSLFSACVGLQIEHGRSIYPVLLQDFMPNEISISIQMERSCNISLTPSEAGQGSTPLCSTKNITEGSSVSDFEGDYSTINIHTPKTELISPLSRNNGELKELERSKNVSDSENILPTVMESRRKDI